MTVHPVKTQISLGIRPVWSESLLSAWRKLGSLATHWAQAKTLIRLGGCPGWSESLLGAQSFCWFCHEAAQLSSDTSDGSSHNGWECPSESQLFKELLWWRDYVNFSHNTLPSLSKNLSELCHGITIIIVPLATLKFWCKVNFNFLIFVIIISDMHVKQVEETQLKAWKFAYQTKHFWKWTPADKRDLTTLQYVEKCAFQKCSKSPFFHCPQTWFILLLCIATDLILLNVQTFCSKVMWMLSWQPYYRSTWYSKNADVAIETKFHGNKIQLFWRNNQPYS